ncbi:hypothetical protein DFJ77DRAFT_531548 [Powellomyces hirtus]|nr:hypothetical protein DFJ77DRAFT_531548 [Powellomyces hirtus]
MSTPAESFPSINIAAAVSLTVVMIAAFAVTVLNLRRTKIWALGWVIAYVLLRMAAFIMRIVVADLPMSNASEVNHKITLLLVDSVFFTAGYFFLFNCVLSLLTRWVDPEATKPEHGQRKAVTTRILKYIHLAVLAATALSIYGGVQMATLPHSRPLSPENQEKSDKSTRYRSAGVYLMLAAAAGMLFAVVYKLATGHRGRNVQRAGLTRQEASRVSIEDFYTRKEVVEDVVNRHLAPMMRLLGIISCVDTSAGDA